jgi:hypothetical protein
MSAGLGFSLIQRWFAINDLKIATWSVPVFSRGGRGVPWREPPGMGRLRSIVAGGALPAAVVAGEERRSPPPDPPLHATVMPSRATTSHLATDWEEQPPIALSLYLSA